MNLYAQRFRKFVQVNILPEGLNVWGIYGGMRTINEVTKQMDMQYIDDIKTLHTYRLLEPEFFYSA